MTAEKVSMSVKGNGGCTPLINLNAASALFAGLLDALVQQHKKALQASSDRGCGHAVLLFLVCQH